jgi:hypothetical protein
MKKLGTGSVSYIFAAPESNARVSDTEWTAHFFITTCFDAVRVMRAHAVPDLKPNPPYLTNFLGVLIDPKFSLKF